MKKIWKWVIGIVVGLVVLGLLVGAAFLVRSNFHAARVTVGNDSLQFGYGGRGPGMMGFNDNDGNGRGYGMMGPYGSRHMGGFGMMGFNPLGGLIGGLFSLGLLTLLVLGIIWMVRKLRTPQAIPAVSAAPAAPAVAMHACPKCGASVQDDWKNCPHCGRKQ